MPGRPKEQKLLRALHRRAQTELGLDASITDYVVSWVASGKTITKLAREMASEISESCSRSWISGVLNRRPENKARIIIARVEAAHALAEEAMEILDNMDEDRDAIAKAKARADLRLWMASKWNRKDYGADQSNVNVNVLNGQLHLDALRQHALANPKPQIPDAEYEVLAPDSTSSELLLKERSAV